MAVETEARVGGKRAVKHEVFVVGRIRKGEQQLVFLDPAARPVFPGPWTIRAVLRA